MRTFRAMPRGYCLHPAGVNKIIQSHWHLFWNRRTIGASAQAKVRHHAESLKLRLYRFELRVDFLKGKAFGDDPALAVGQHQPGKARDARDPSGLL